MRILVENSWVGEIPVGSAAIWPTPLHSDSLTKRTSDAETQKFAEQDRGLCQISVLE